MTPPEEPKQSGLKEWLKEWYWSSKEEKRKRAKQDVKDAARELGSVEDSELNNKADTLEVLGRLHAVEVERFYERRRLEWRLAFTLWLALVAVGALVVDNLPGDVSRNRVGVAIAIVGAIITVAHFAFEMKAIAPGAARGRSIGYAMGNLERKAIGLEPAYPEHTYRKFWSHYWLPTVTLLLASAVTVVAILQASAPIQSAGP